MRSQSTAIQKQLEDFPQIFNATAISLNHLGNLRRGLSGSDNDIVPQDSQAVVSNTTPHYQVQTQITTAQDAKHAAVGNASQWWSTIQTNATDTVDQYTAQVNTLLHDAEANATAVKQDLYDEYQQQKSQFLRVMLPDIIRSYLLALLQLGFIFLLTSDKIKTWLTNRSLALATHQVNNTLQETGVTAAVDDVIGVRLPRIRQKVERALEAAQQLDAILNKLGNVDQLGQAAEKVGELADKMGDKLDTLGDKFGRFGKKK